MVPFSFKLNIHSLAVVLCLWFADKKPNKIRCRCIWIMIIWHKNVPNRMSSLWASTDAPNHLLCMLIYTSDNYLLCFLVKYTLYAVNQSRTGLCIHLHRIMTAFCFLLVENIFVHKGGMDTSTTLLMYFFFFHKQ